MARSLGEILNIGLDSRSARLVEVLGLVKNPCHARPLEALSMAVAVVRADPDVAPLSPAAIKAFRKS
jgi:hypothetical protein